MTTVLDDLAAAVAGRDRHDPHVWVRRATDAHRRRHGCWAFPFADGTVLGALGAALAPARVLELGTALGYTACWWGGAAGAVDTVENDPGHVRLAREHLATAGRDGRVTVHEGDFAAVLPGLTGPYDVAFFDGYEPAADVLEAVGRLVRPGGVLVTTNLGLGGGFCAVTGDPRWSTRLLDRDTAISVRG